ncbi:MAG: HypC/HybG/HupF family hydrogenase formation chaperone [Candidatus Thiodiazotropha sp. (ex Codakia orbicularis)]|nr:HypC/HybG/HupF family hydrogenase formation chaperone [Candidatus Thiodiazotropha sp. (ex Codakia orbicularis)]
MCLALPAKIVAVVDAAQYLVMVECNGNRLQANAATLQTGAKPLEMLLGEWVLLHQGFAMQRISSSDALSILDALKALKDPEKVLDVSEFSQRQLADKGLTG